MTVEQYMFNQNVYAIKQTLVTHSVENLNCEPWPTFRELDDTFCDIDKDFLDERYLR